jgi:tight adherence protein C
MLLLVLSAAITIFLLATVLIVALTGKEPIDARLAEVGVQQGGATNPFLDAAPTGIAAWATGLTGFLKPLRDLITGNDEDLSYRLSLAGYRKPEHVELYAAAKMLLPVIAIIIASFTDNIFAVALIGVVVGFLGPDLLVTQLITRRSDSVRRALPDALDLLVICMEAGLGIDQALIRVGDDIRLSCPALADEFLIVSREQRAGKPRLDAWRGIADRLNLDVVREFVTMLVQTERFGTPIAGALGQFADSIRVKRMQAAEEAAAKTGVKLLFPLVLFIFPSIFVVLLGPAVLHIAKGLSDFFQ